MAAAEAPELPWDEQTGEFIDAIDDANKASKAYDISLRDLLLDPTKYISISGFDQKLNAVQAAVNSYFKELLEGLADEQKDLDRALAICDMGYEKINGVISMKSSAARVPYVKPYFVYTNPEEREEIIIEKYSEDLDALIGKLSNSSNYIADLSGSYKEHRFGSWLFSGSKNHVLTVRAPASIIMDIDRSSTLIGDMLATIAAGAAQK